MNADLDKLKYTIEQLNIANDEREVMLQLLSKIEKDLGGRWAVESDPVKAAKMIGM